jgi:hypothetical protein
MVMWFVPHLRWEMEAVINSSKRETRAIELMFCWTRAFVLIGVTDRHAKCKMRAWNGNHYVLVINLTWIWWLFTWHFDSLEIKVSKSSDFNRFLPRSPRHFVDPSSWHVSDTGVLQSVVFMTTWFLGLRQLFRECIVHRSIPKKIAEILFAL